MSKIIPIIDLTVVNNGDKIAIKFSTPVLNTQQPSKIIKGYWLNVKPHTSPDSDYFLLAKLYPHKGSFYPFENFLLYPTSMMSNTKYDVWLVLEYLDGQKSIANISTLTTNNVVNYTDIINLAVTSKADVALTQKQNILVSFVKPFSLKIPSSEIKEYEIELTLHDGTHNPILHWTQPAAPNPTSDPYWEEFTWEGGPNLLGKTKYDVRVAPIRLNGDIAAYSDSFTFTSPATNNDTVPDAPTNLILTVVNSELFDLVWEAPVNNGGTPITDYIIKRNLNDAGWKPVVRLPSTTLSYSDNGIKEGDKVSYTVSAFNKLGTGKPSNIAKGVSPIIPVGNDDEIIWRFYQYSIDGRKNIIEDQHLGYFPKSIYSEVIFYPLNDAYFVNGKAYMGFWVSARKLRK